MDLTGGVATLYLALIHGAKSSLTHGSKICFEGTASTAADAAFQRHHDTQPGSAPGRPPECIQLPGDSLHHYDYGHLTSPLPQQ